MATAASIIEQKGGATRVAQALDRKPGLVRVWKHRNHFPRSAWPDLLSAFPDLTLEQLRAAEGATPAGRA